ncbi:MAG: cob(I)yrinic acid a,c-diamide adenosyltransferase, partial [Candidatus Omnitrophica bacterium]|nr:cob(I)yrinic acid a,c-diamide adenosyltransferase [Candidatus Omnitrophota bacterium]
MRLKYFKLEGGCPLIQVYTGSGKGKTTAALGLALRAAGAGLRIYIAQFAKGKKCSEFVSLKKIKKIT